MARTYNRINAANVGSGSGAIPYSTVFTLSDWNGPSGGFYTITILEAAHNKGTSPGVEIFELVSGDYIQVEVDRVRVNSGGDVEVRVPETPDLRFNGKIVILD